MEAILSAVITVIFTLAVSFALPFIRNGAELLKDERVKSLVYAAVNAAEQIIRREKGGSERLELVREFLKSMKVDAESEYVKALIEAEVYRNKKPGTSASDNR